ncbi:hypothetical protein R0I52_02430 [Psychrobacter sp. CAM01]|uniref:hypothetical protein n=1 Tax=Psychrobacter sp. CAM01 TaxID=3080335 RepID=UPI0029359D4E|nr:hypothetical protein [Psychrobacter sp. CAM01]MDV2859564.1 hypothetical protein [Psychrobacter sp. CAM01]
MKKSVLNTALSTAFIVALGFGISACSGDKEGESHQVLAKDRVDEASELARSNAPAAEQMDFPETAPMTTESTDDESTDTEGTEAQGEAVDADTAEAADADSAAAMPASDAEADADAEPATNE